MSAYQKRKMNSTLNGNNFNTIDNNNNPRDTFGSKKPSIQEYNPLVSGQRKIKVVNDMR